MKRITLLAALLILAACSSSTEPRPTRHIAPAGVRADSSLVGRVRLP